MSTESEFEGIFEPGSASRPVMSKPPPVHASMKLVREVRDMLVDAEGDATAVADWIADKMERFGARTARPVFDMEGYGLTCCSWCDEIWPLCGHQYLSERIGEGRT